MPTLHVLQGPDKGRTYETPNEPAVIGRTSDQIHLSDNSSSRRHAELRPHNGDWFIYDLNSSNGTFVNGQRVVDSVRLKHGDQIRVGTTLLVFAGQDHVGNFSGPGVIRDLVDLDMSNPSGGSSILAAIGSAEDSVILQPPETADAVAAWNVIYQLAETLGSIESLDAFLQRVTDIVFEHMLVDHLVMLTRKDEQSELTPAVVRFRGRDRDGKKRITTSQTIIQHVVETRGGVLCANAATDERFSQGAAGDSIHQLGLRSVMCVPIMTGEIVRGVIHLDCAMARHTYTQEQLRLAVAVGRLIGMAIQNHELQEERVKTERLAAAGEAVAYLSHYIRNVLQGMQSGADVVEIGLKKKSFETTSSGWALIRNNLNRILLLTMNMLTFSKNRKPSISSANVNTIIEDVVQLSQSRADERSVVVLTELDDLPAVPVDTDGLHQVIHNIVLNAVDACPKEGGRVTISSKFEPKLGAVHLAISDNGHGIPPELRGRIFHAFQSSKGHGGTGLGLAAAKKILDELGGEIEVESEPEHGTTFHVRLIASHVTLDDSEATHHGPVAR